MRINLCSHFEVVGEGNSDKKKVELYVDLQREQYDEKKQIIKRSSMEQ